MIFVESLLECALKIGALKADAICIIVTTGNTILLMANIVDRDLLQGHFRVVYAVGGRTL